MPTTNERLARIERILLALGQERYGGVGLGPADPSYRELKNQIRLDLHRIAQEQAEAPLETRS
jgi:hypothetical protein